MVVLCGVLGVLTAVAPTAAGDPRLSPAGPGGVVGFGDAADHGTPGGTLSSVVTAIVSTPDGRGYWLAGADGQVYALGDATFEGSLDPAEMGAPVVAMAATPDGLGYWLTTPEGDVFSFGDAPNFGSLAGAALSQPVVGMAATRDGGGYWLVAADGGLFSFGDARFFGSTGGMPLVSHVVGMAVTPDGGGYWLAAADGGVFCFGDARWFGSMGERPLDSPVVGMAATTDGGGYWLVASDGGVFSFGDAPWLGSPAGTAPPTRVAAMAATPDGHGYWLLEPDLWPYSFADPSSAVRPGSARIVAAAAGEVGIDPRAIATNRAGRYQPWNALFAAWAWQQAGIRIPPYPTSRSIGLWANQHRALLRRTVLPAPGDIALYGTGLRNNRTSVHAEVVVQVWPDGAVVTVDGDAGPGAAGHRGVVLDGPFLPVFTTEVTGTPVYAYADPR